MKITTLGTYDGVEIIKDKSGLYDLNRMWEAAGSPPNKDPRQWHRLPSTQAFLQAAAEELNVEGKHIYITRRGKHGGTWAHQLIAIQYAQYLNTRFAIWVSKVVYERMEEEANPELAYERGRERAVAYYRQKGFSDEWIAQRIKGMEDRLSFTDAMKQQGLSNYSACTNMVNYGVIGTTANVIRRKMGLPADANIRDAQPRVVLLGIALAEEASKDAIVAADIRNEDDARRKTKEIAEQVGKIIPPQHRITKDDATHDGLQDNGGKK